MRAMESSLSSLCCRFCLTARVYQVGPRCGFPLSLGIDMAIWMAKLQGVFQWPHQSSKLLAWCEPKEKWRELRHVWMITRRSDGMGSIIAPPTFIVFVAGLFTQGSIPMASGWWLRMAPILNGEGMGANLPYLWPGLPLCNVALMYCMSPHPELLCMNISWKRCINKKREMNIFFQFWRSWMPRKWVEFGSTLSKYMYCYWHSKTNNGAH